MAKQQEYGFIRVPKVTLDAIRRRAERDHRTIGMTVRLAFPEEQ